MMMMIDEPDNKTDNHNNVNLPMDQSSPPPPGDLSAAETDGWTGQKRAKLVVARPPTTTRLEYYRQLADPDYKEKTWDVYDDPDQLGKVLERIALYRIKANELFWEGKEVDMAQLREDYSSDTLRDEGYFVQYEMNREWYFDPEYCRRSEMDDYQRLVLRCDVDDTYTNWESYHRTCATLKCDLEFLQFYEELSSEVKSIEDDDVQPTKEHFDAQHRRYDNKAHNEAPKIAARFCNISAHLVYIGVTDSACSAMSDIIYRKDLDRVLFEIWKRIAKHKVDFRDALEDLYKRGLYPLQHRFIKAELEEHSLRSITMKDAYYTHLAHIDEKVPEDEVLVLIKEAVDKIMPSQEQEQQDAREHVPTMGSEGERRSRQGQGPRQKKKKKTMWSPVSRHHVVASLVSRSQAARRASPAARKASPATRKASPDARKASPAGTPQAAAVLESLRTLTFIHNDYVPYSVFPEPMDVEHNVEDDSDHNAEDNFDLDAEDDVEGDEQHVEDVEFLTASASIRALTSKFRSEAWKEYVPVIVDGQISEARCKHCDNTISAKRGQGTSALLKHLDRCKKRDVALRIVQGLNSTLRSPDGRRLKNWNFDPVIARKELARMIALHGLPFILVEYDGFRRFVASLNPLFKTISRTTIRNDCIKAFQEQKVALQEMFKDAQSRFSLTADMWTSNQTLGYMCITCHYITADWEIEKKVIKFFVVETPHTGIEMFNQVLECIQEWNIEYKLFGITLDNAAANDSIVFELKRNLVDKMALPVSGVLLHNRCSAHVINLIAHDGLHEEEVKKIVSNIRESVKYIRSSEGQKKKFKIVIAKAGLPLGPWPTMDTPTRWNSTYLMIEKAMEYIRAFDSLAKQDSNYTYAPSVKDWEKATVLCKVLKVFYDATMVVSGTSYPTSNLYFHEMWKIKITLHNESSNADLGPMIAVMKTKFNKYWYDIYMNLAIPVILDPRFKFKYVEFRLKQAFVNDPQPRIDRVRKTFRSLFNEYFSQLNNDNNNFSQESGQDHSQMITADDDIFGDWDDHLNEHRQDPVTTELDRYLNESPISRSREFDILKWWSANSSTYPTLAAIARDVLAVPASTVASESAFSMGGRILTDFRSRLSVKSVEALICSQDWYRGSDSHRRRMGAITDLVDLRDTEIESPLA